MHARSESKWKRLENRSQSSHTEVVGRLQPLFREHICHINSVAIQVGYIWLGRMHAK